MEKLIVSQRNLEIGTTRAWSFEKHLQSEEVSSLIPEDLSREGRKEMI